MQVKVVKRQYTRQPCTCSTVIKQCPACKLWAKSHRVRKPSTFNIEDLNKRVELAQAKYNVIMLEGTPREKKQYKWYVRMLTKQRDNLAKELLENEDTLT